MVPHGEPYTTGLPPIQGAINVVKFLASRLHFQALLVVACTHRMGRHKIDGQKAEPLTKALAGIQVL